MEILNAFLNSFQVVNEESSRSEKLDRIESLMVRILPYIYDYERFGANVDPFEKPKKPSGPHPGLTACREFTDIAREVTSDDGSDIDDDGLMDLINGGTMLYLVCSGRFENCDANEYWHEKCKEVFYFGNDLDQEIRKLISPLCSGKMDWEIIEYIKEMNPIDFDNLIHFGWRIYPDRDGQYIINKPILVFDYILNNKHCEHCSALEFYARFAKLIDEEGDETGGGLLLLLGDVRKRLNDGFYSKQKIGSEFVDPDVMYEFEEMLSLDGDLRRKEFGLNKTAMQGFTT